VLKQGSKHEFHHIFPQAYLEKAGVDKRHINVLANICFLTRSDNNAIKAKSPEEYLASVSDSVRGKYLDEALCPENISQLSYEDFVVRRAEMLNAAALALMGA